jgi:ribosomal-protein-alanine N-acetyltransferase
MSATRLVTPDDAAILADLLRANRDFLAPWDPIRADDFFTVAGQRRVVRSALEQHEQGSALPHVIVDVDGRVVGRSR